MPSFNPVLLSDARVLAAHIIFAGSYIVFALGKFPWMKIDRPGAAIIQRLHPRHLLPTVIFTSGLFSAFLVNDIVCLVMTPLALRMARRLGLPPIPYVVAVATASNIGSTATITGNPQNMLIGSLSGIPYVEFLAHLAPVALAGLFLNWALLHRLYLPGSVDRVPVADVPAAMMAAIGAALLLITRTVDPRKMYDEVDWGLLVFFLGLFIIVGGAERAGLTSHLLRPVATWNLHRIPIFVAVTALLCNVVSNVPAVMLLRTLVSGFPDPHTGWLALPMASTLAGNLTTTGSVANIIVVERAAAEGVHVGFREYFRVGLPVTAATLAVGSVWLWLT